MFEQLKWLTFENRCIYHIGLLIFKCQKQLLPDYISELIIFSNNENYSLRSAARNEIIQLKPRTNFLKDTFSYSSTEIWKNIPKDIKNCATVILFKNYFRRFLLNAQNSEI